MGNLLACDEVECYLEPHFYGVPQFVPVYFVADSSADSGVVKIRVGLIDYGEGGGAGIAAQTDTSGFKRIGKEKPKVERKKNRSLVEKAAFIKDVRNKINSSTLSAPEKEKMFEKLNNIASPGTENSLCFVGEFVESIYSNANVVMSKQPELIIIYPSSDSDDEKITKEPQMPDVVCKAQLKNYNQGQVTFEWKYTVVYTFQRYTLDGNSNQVGLCPRSGTTVFNGVSYSYNDLITELEVPFKKDSASFYYQNVNRDECDQVVSTYEGSDDIFTGGKVSVELTAKDKNGKVISSVGRVGNNIVGDNPEISEVKNGLTMHEQITVFLESVPKWKHFNENNRNDFNKTGNPSYGYPNGFGLMQTDFPPANELQLWNWRANRELGKSILNDKYNGAQRYPQNVRNFRTWYMKGSQIRYRDPIRPHNKDWYPRAYYNASDFSTDEQIWKETHQRYRGGTYWRWQPDDPENENSAGKWVASPSQPHTRGDEAWEIYENIQAGNYPDGWN